MCTANNAELLKHAQCTERDGKKWLQKDGVGSKIEHR